MTFASCGQAAEQSNLEPSYLVQYAHPLQVLRRSHQYVEHSAEDSAERTVTKILPDSSSQRVRR